MSRPSEDLDTKSFVILTKKLAGKQQDFKLTIIFVLEF